MPQSSVTVTFQDPAGNPLSGGSVTFDLNTDIATATSGGTQVCAGRTVTATLDTNGSATLSLWPNASLFPASSVYFVRAFTAQGQPAWSGEMTVT